MRILKLTDEQYALIKVCILSQVDLIDIQIKLLEDDIKDQTNTPEEIKRCQELLDYWNEEMDKHKFIYDL